MPDQFANTQKYGVMWWIRCRLRGIRTKQEGRRLLRRAKREDYRDA